MGVVATAGAQSAAMTLDQAVLKVQQDTGGKVLSAKQRGIGHRQEYRIKVLTPDGHVREMAVSSEASKNPVSTPSTKNRPARIRAARRNTDAHPVGGGRGAVARDAGGTPEAGRFCGRCGAGWRGGHLPRPRGAVRSGDHRPGPAQDVRHGSGQGAARGRPALSDPDPDRTRQLAGQGRGAEVRCRRLPGQAVPRRGTAGAHQRAGARASGWSKPIWPAA
jgi:hypothetical protein